MNKFELTCNYCDNTWEINYTPNSFIYCGRCRDSNVKYKNIATDKIDYYAGTKPFQEEVKKKKDEDRYYF